MKILTSNFYKFLFGFIGVVLASLVFIFVAGILGRSDEISTDVNVAGECPQGVASC